MRVGDIIKVLGESPLSAFPWGEQVVITINAFLDTRTHITLSDNGHVIAERLNQLPSEVCAYLYEREITQPPIVVTPPVLPPADPPVPAPLPTDEHHFIPNWRSMLVGLFGILLLLAAGNIAFNEHVKMLHAYGVEHNDGVFTRFIKVVLHEFMKEEEDAQDDKDAADALRGHSASHPAHDSSS